MRTRARRSIVTAVSLLMGLGLSNAASALSINLEWAGSGTHVTTATFGGSAIVTLGVYATITVPPGLDLVVLSIGWDTNALSLVQCTPANTTVAQYVAGGSFQPLNNGPGATCDNAIPGLQPALTQLANWHPSTPYGPGELHIADLQFHVGPLAPSNRVVQSLMRPAYDGWADNNFGFSMNAVLGTATVELVPEPTTALLVGGGLLALLAAARRQRRG